MTKVERLNLFNEFLKEDLGLSSEDFFSVSIDRREVSMQWNGRNKNYSFSTLVGKFDNVSRFAYVKDYKCEWNNEYHWFDINFKVLALDNEEYKVKIVIH
tara:strand:- start:22 stop:321 length:300 start_codon:yes stop_codon:yes gene_type:complete